MSSIDERLAALLQADPPPARDAMFRLEVMRRLEKRAMLNRSLGVALSGLVALLLFVFIVPVLPDAREPAGQIIACMLGACGALVFAYAPRRSF